jgi:hypothetical protein
MAFFQFLVKKHGIGAMILTNHNNNIQALDDHGTTSP